MPGIGERHEETKGGLPRFSKKKKKVESEWKAHAGICGCEGVYRDNFPTTKLSVSRIKRSNLFSSPRKMGYVSLGLELESRKISMQM